MERRSRFKCCANKTTGNLWCVVCQNVFHPSCLQRDFQNHTIIERHKIYCSSECKQQASSEGTLGLDPDVDQLLQVNHDLKCTIQSKMHELESQLQEKDVTIKDLQDEVETLQADLKTAERHARKQRTRSLDFESEVLESEKKFVDALNNKRKELLKVTEELNKLIVQNKELMCEVDKHKQETTSRDKDINELNDINRNMVTSIRVLEVENRTYQAEIDNLKLEVSRLKSLQPDRFSCDTDLLVGGCAPIILPETTKGSNSLPKPTKILILGDQTVKGLVYHLRQKLGDSVIVESIVKTYATCKQVLENIGALVSSLGEQDYVVVSCGSVDLELTSFPRLRYINNKLKECLHTNVIFLSPTVLSNKFGNYYTCKFNNKFEGFLNYVNRYTENIVSYLNIGNRYGYKLSNFIVSRLLNNFILESHKLKKCKNLIHIKCKGSFYRDLSESTNSCVCVDEICLTDVPELDVSESVVDNPLDEGSADEQTSSGKERSKNSRNFLEPVMTVTLSP